MKLLLLAAALGLVGAAASRPHHQQLRDCESCVAVEGYGWCPIARKCSPGYPGKAGSCRGGETDFARAAAQAADHQLKEKLQEDEREFSLAVLFYNVKEPGDRGGADDSASHTVEQWEVAAQHLQSQLDVRFFTLDCETYANACSVLLPDDVTQAAVAVGGGTTALFFAAGHSAGKWGCPNGEELCDTAYPKAFPLGTEGDAAAIEASVSNQMALQRGFPLPLLEELAADFVRVALMRSGEVDDDNIEQALLEKAKQMAGPGGEYGTQRQQAAAAKHFLNAMEALLKVPSGRGRRISTLSQMANQAASAAKRTHGSLDSYVDAQAKDYAMKSLTKPLFG